MTKKVQYVIFVNWGSMRTAFGVTSYGLMEYPGQLAMSVSMAFAKLMLAFPGREGSRPLVPSPDVQYRLRIQGADDTLKPLVMMHRSFEGHWKTLDQEALERLGYNELTEELRGGESYIELELVEVHSSNLHNN